MRQRRRLTCHPAGGRSAGLPVGLPLAATSKPALELTGQQTNRPTCLKDRARSWGTQGTRPKGRNVLQKLGQTNDLLNEDL